MNIKELHSFRLSDAVKFHDTLNPALFQDDRLQPEVRRKLLRIARDFMDHMGVDTGGVSDITMSGSNAAYTYTPHSDIDVAVVIDYDRLKNDEVYRELFMAKRLLFNDGHDITVRGYRVEIYVQDRAQSVKSLGEYSLLRDRWINHPVKRRANLDQTVTRHKFEKLAQLSELALRSQDLERVNRLLDILWNYRKAGLDANGEFGPENLVYKAMRTQGILDRLHDHRDRLHSDTLSLDESGEQQLLEQLRIKKKLGPQLFVPRSDMPIDETLKPRAARWTSTARQTDRGWTSDWVEWCVGNQPDWINKEGILYDVAPTARILSINTDRDAILVAKHYGVTITNDGIGQFLDLIQRMPWDRIGEDWDAVHHQPRDRWKNIYMSTWDVESTAWINREVLVNPRRVRIDLGQLDAGDLELQEASGYIPSSRERNDPRFKTALTVDIKPDSIQQNARKLGLGRIHRSGVPQQARADGKIGKIARSTK